MTITERVRKDGTETFLVRPHVDGRRLKAKTFTDPDMARDYERLMQAKGRKGVYAAEACDTYARRWLSDRQIVKSGPTRGKKKTRGTLATYRNDLRPFFDVFEGRMLDDVGKPEARCFGEAHPRAAAVARNVFEDAIGDELVRFNPFANLRLEQSRGRKDHDPLRRDEIADLCDVARGVYPGTFGRIMAGFIDFTSLVGHRIEEGRFQRFSDMTPESSEIFVRETKLDKPETVVLLPDAWDAIKDSPARPAGHVIVGKQGRAIRTNSGFYWAWRPVREVFWAKLSEQRRREIVKLDWHSLRHACGFHFYVTLGLGAEAAAFQLRHSSKRLVEDLYGHYKSGALDRVKAEALAAAGAPVAGSAPQVERRRAL
jgi:integrase